MHEIQISKMGKHLRNLGNSFPFFPYKFAPSNIKYFNRKIKTNETNMLLHNTLWNDINFQQHGVPYYN